MGKFTSQELLYLCEHYMWQSSADAHTIMKLLDHIKDLDAELDEAQLRSIEARNPGIDMDEVRRERNRK